MQREKLITIIFIGIVLIIFGTLIALVTKSTPKEKFCVTEIPNQIKFECPAENDTRIVNSFDTSLFEYNNAKTIGCTINQTIEEYGFHYEVAKCNSSIPFRQIS